MLIDLCLASKAVWRILFLYAETPGGGFTREDLRSHTKLGNKALTLGLNKMTSCGLLNIDKEQFSYKVYKLNKENIYLDSIISIMERERKEANYLPYDIMVIVKRFISKVLDITPVQSIFVFGSVAKGTYRKDSDIDFAIVVSLKDTKNDVLISEAANDVSVKYKRKIQYFIYSEKEFDGLKTDLKKEILKHGVRVV